MNKYSYHFIFHVLFLSFTYAQGGSTGLAFLKLGVGARNVAMGDVGVVSAEGGGAMHYNAANILNDKCPVLTIMHNEWIQVISTEYIGASIPFDWWGLGFHVNTTSVRNIEVRDVPGIPIGTFTARDFSTGISIAFMFDDNLFVGATAKYLFEKIYVNNADGYAFDLGVRYQTDIPNLSTGFAVTNLGSMRALKIESIKLPALMRLGAAYVMPLGFLSGNLLIEADGATVFREKKFTLNVGVEADYQRIVFLRAGYQTVSDIKGFSGGIGAVYSQFRFDYGFTPFQNDFGSSQTISLSYQF